MSLNGWLQIFLFIAAVLLLAKPMGSYLLEYSSDGRPFLIRCWLRVNGCSIA